MHAQAHGSPMCTCQQCVHTSMMRSRRMHRHEAIVYTALQCHGPTEGAKKCMTYLISILLLQLDLAVAEQSRQSITTFKHVILQKQTALLLAVSNGQRLQVDGVRTSLKQIKLHHTSPFAHPVKPRRLQMVGGCSSDDQQ